MSEYQKRSLLKDLQEQLKNKIASMETSSGSAPDKGEENEETKDTKATDGLLGPT